MPRLRGSGEGDWVHRNQRAMTDYIQVRKEETMEENVRTGRPRTPEQVIDGVMHKFCPECETFVELESGYYRGRKDGSVITPCKACRKVLTNAWRQRNPERTREITRQSRERAKANANKS